MPAFKVCAVSRAPDRRPDDVDLLTVPPARRPPFSRTRRPTDPTARRMHRPPTPKGRPHAHAEPLPARHLPVHRRRASTSRRRSTPTLSYVGAGRRRSAQALYFRGGNTTDELVAVVLMRDGVPMRYFPIGAKGDVHVPLRVVEDLDGGTAIELHIAAPEGLTGTVVVDLGLVEV